MSKFLPGVHLNGGGELGFDEVLWCVPGWYGTVPRILQITPSDVDVNFLRVDHNAA